MMRINADFVPALFFKSILLWFCFNGLLAPQQMGQEPATSQLKSPKEFFGFELGERYNSHAKVVRYCEHLAAHSDRVTYEVYGHTAEGRELVLMHVGSAENMANKDVLLQQFAELADPRRVKSEEQKLALLAETPANVWLSFCVHGNETSCTEAALKTLYRLASSDDEEVTKILDNVFIHIDPCSNPDGRDRFVNWFNSVVGKNPDDHPRSVEHDEPWPGGRTNHFYFDLNRDWAFMSQIETKSRIRQFIKWNPHVHVDYHEMGQNSSYFFFPAERPINANLPPSILAWGEKFGRGNAAAFDQRGWRYYTAESFDLFYPGYGDSWPSFQGAIGMTYEQAGHSSSGAAVKLRNGKVLTLKERTEHHYVTALSTLSTAANQRNDLVEHYYDFRNSAIIEGRGGRVREYILLPGRDRERAARLTELLIAQGVEVRQASKKFKARGCWDAHGKRVEERQFPAGCYLVSTAQPTKRLIKTLLEPKTTIRELYFYDISAWSLPLSFGVDAFWCEQATKAETTVVAGPIKIVGSVAEGEAGYGYLLSWQEMTGIKAAVALAKKGLEIRSAGRPFTLNGHKWDRGTVFIPRPQDHGSFDALIAQIAAETGADFVPTATGMTEKGIDLGSSRFSAIRKPKLALIMGSGISSNSYGATRFMVEQLYDLPYSSFLASALSRVDLDDYTAVVVPDGYGGFSKSATEKLKSFVREGGALVLLRGSARAFSKEGNGFGRASFKADATAKVEKKVRPKIEEEERHRRRQSTPGSIFTVKLDPAHPLSFGYRNEISVFQSGMMSLNTLGGGVPVARFADAPPVSGYILSESERKLRGRAYAVVERMGRGSVVYFAGDPNFRSAWHGLTRLFLNAVLLLPKY